MLLSRIKNKSEEAIQKICIELGMGRNEVKRVIVHRSKWTFDMLREGKAVRWRYFGAFTPWPKKPKIKEDDTKQETLSQPT